VDTIEYAKGAKTEADYLERVRYFPHQLVTAGDLTQDQNHQRAKRRLHNRLLHGWGIVCGLEVKKNARSDAPLNVTICPGYALSPQGDEIHVPTELQFDLGQCIQGQGAPCRSPCGPIVLGAVDPKKEFYIAIRYAECPSHPVRVAPVGCGCDDTLCEYSRIRDSFDVSCLGALPPSYANEPPIGNVCEILTTSKLIPCPPCPDSPWIVLAKVKLAADANSIADILVDDRRPMLSTAVIQEYIRFQCS
jgi:hypothetical protein